MKKSRILIKMIAFATVLSTGLVIGACQNKPAETLASTQATEATAATTAVTTATEPFPTAGDNPFAVNPLTGVQDMNPDNVGKRSISVSINNHPEALPSRGISVADVIYEFETEGGQTRMLALFADVSKVPEVGSLRSARIIAADLSAGTNSIFVHYGKNARVPDFLSANDIDHIDGNNYSKERDQSVDGKITLPDNIYFWRDSDWMDARDLEHTAVTNGEQILRAMEDLKVEATGETPLLFPFAPEGSKALTSGEACDKLVVYFSTNNDDSTFTYDPATKLYLKSEYGDPQIDETTGNQISVTNVVVLFANIKPHGDTTIDAYLTDGGTGYYASEGKIIPITWSKNGPHDPIVLMDSKGQPIEVNCGKSYINVVRNSVSAKTTWTVNDGE